MPLIIQPVFYDIQGKRVFSHWEFGCKECGAVGALVASMLLYPQFHRCRTAVKK